MLETSAFYIFYGVKSTFMNLFDKTQLLLSTLCICNNLKPTNWKKKKLAIRLTEIIMSMIANNK